MSFSFISRFEVAPEREADFIAAARSMEIFARSADNIGLFKFFRGEKAHSYVVIESFSDEKASAAFDETAECKPLVITMVSAMIGSHERELLLDL